MARVSSLENCRNTENENNPEDMKFEILKMASKLLYKNRLINLDIDMLINIPNGNT